MGTGDMKLPNEMMYNQIPHFLWKFWWIWDPVPDWFKLDDKVRVTLLKENLTFNKLLLAKNIEIMQSYQVHIEKVADIVGRAM